MSRPNKTLSEMTPRELAAIVEDGTGVKAPPEKAPQVAWAGWFAAIEFILQLQRCSTPAEGRAAAATNLLRHNERDLALYQRFIEEGLGRPLTDAELEAKEVRADPD